MTSRIAHTTIDSADPYALSEWWKGVLDYVEVPDEPNSPGDEECMLQRPDGSHQLLFLHVPDVRSVKNRLHFDLRPTTGSRDEEVARLIEAGAVQLDDRRGLYGPGTGWVVLADPEGNEFCVLRSDAELAQSS